MEAAANGTAIQGYSRHPITSGPITRPRHAPKIISLHEKRRETIARKGCQAIFDQCAVRLIEQILAPLIVALAEQPHQMPASMQTERPRRARQAHARFIRRTAPLAVIAGMAAGHQILPRRLAGARA